jgi:hypothetical protein
LEFYGGGGIGAQVIRLDCFIEYGSSEESLRAAYGLDAVAAHILRVIRAKSG